MSWIVICKQTGKAVLETFEKSTMLRINRDKYDVKTAKEYLSSLNNKI